MKNDESEFCNFELYGFLVTRINCSLWILLSTYGILYIQIHDKSPCYESTNYYKKIVI